MSNLLHVGLDVGSTTVKIVVMNEKQETIYSDYQRHFSDTKNTNSEFETRKLQKSIIYGDSVDLGTVTTAKSTDDSVSIDVIFSDSYKLTTIDTVQYTITSNSTDFYLSNTTEFIVRYDSQKGLYYFTIPITNTANFVENNMYNIGMNFYTSNRLVTQTETSYYYVS